MTVLINFNITRDLPRFLRRDLECAFQYSEEQTYLKRELEREKGTEKEN